MLPVILPWLHNGTWEAALTALVGGTTAEVLMLSERGAAAGMQSAAMRFHWHRLPHQSMCCSEIFLTGFRTPWVRTERVDVVDLTLPFNTENEVRAEGKSTVVTVRLKKVRLMETYLLSPKMSVYHTVLGLFFHRVDSNSEDNVIPSG